MKQKIRIKKFIIRLSINIVKCSVFICYSSENSKEALTIKKLVDYYGGIPFLAPYSLKGGVDSKKTILSNVDNSNIFVPLISQKSSKSPYANQEIGAAILSKMKLKKDIIPVILGRVNQKDLGYLYDLQYYKYNDKEFEKHLKSRILTKYFKVLAVYSILLIFLLIVFYTQ